MTTVLLVLILIVMIWGMIDISSELRTIRKLLQTEYFIAQYKKIQEEKEKATKIYGN